MIRFLLLFIAIGQFASVGIPQALGLGQGLATRPETGGIPPELPLGIFFMIIWNVIFVLYLINAVVAVRRGSFVDTYIGAPLVIAGAMNIVWILSAQFIHSIWTDFILLFPVMVTAWEASRRLDRIGGFDGTNARLLLCSLTGMLSGWITTAVTISVPDVVREVLGHHASDFVWPYLWLTLAVGAALAFVFARYISQSLWYFVGLGWGIAGIAANTMTRLDMPLLGYIAAAFGLVLLYARLTRGADGARAS